MERYKARLVAKVLLKRKTLILIRLIFSPISTKDSFIIVITLVMYFDIELQQMDANTAFLNGNIDKIIYMVQPENFVFIDSKKMVCKLKIHLWT